MFLLGAGSWRNILQLQLEERLLEDPFITWRVISEMNEASESLPHVKTKKKKRPISHFIIVVLKIILEK